MDNLEKLLSLLLENNLVNDETTSIMENLKVQLSEEGFADSTKYDELKTENEGLQLQVTDLTTQLSNLKQLYSDTFFGKVEVQSDGTTKKIVEISGQGITNYSNVNLETALDEMF